MAAVGNYIYIVHGTKTIQIIPGLIEGEAEQLYRELLDVLGNYGFQVQRA